VASLAVWECGLVQGNRGNSKGPGVGRESLLLTGVVNRKQRPPSHPHREKTPDPLE
jgi:hypothetical protein